MKSQMISVGVLLILGNLFNCNANLFSPSSSPKRTELELEEVQPSSSGLRGRARKHQKKAATTDSDEDTPHELTHHEYMEQHQLKHHRGRRGGGAAARRKKNQNQKNGDKPKRQRPNKNKKGKNKPNGRQVCDIIYVICILCISYVHRGILCLSCAHASPSSNQLLTAGWEEEQQTWQRKET